MEFFVSTTSLDPKIRSQYWRDLGKSLHVVSPIHGESLDGSVHIRKQGPIEVWSTSFNEQEFHRDRRTIAQTRTDDYIIILTLSGTSTADFNDTNLIANPGDIYIVDLNQPYRSHVSPGRRATWVMSRSLLEKLLGPRNLHGVVLKAGHPMVTLLTDFLKGMQISAMQLSEEEAAMALDAGARLLAGSLIGQIAIPDAVQTIAAQGLRQRIIEFIDHQICNPDLGPDLIIRYFHLSRAYLYRLFDGTDGVARLIREKRLDLGYRMLTAKPTGPFDRQTLVKEVAYSCGFANSETFFRLFKARFCVTPRTAALESASIIIEDREIASRVFRIPRQQAAGPSV